ncbi:hypothetical protein [Planomicrobium sp. CPCC 101110]|uniref:hypothetical protein n=1 Tax=Planomicrobium sp. CPCC 101110 TaxID=2599619 RepID=UPI0016473618|nr:hypothetical protein [Planomicrobium sp. CPCC 101110]
MHTKKRLILLVSYGLLATALATFLKPDSYIMLLWLVPLLALCHYAILYIWILKEKKAA